MDWEPALWIPESYKSFFVIVTHDGRQVLTRCEGERISVVHEIETKKGPYEICEQYRKEICSYFGITGRVQVVTTTDLSSFAQDYLYCIIVVEVTDDDTGDVAAPFLWLDWRSSALDLKSSCPHPHISRFLRSYLSNEDAEEINSSRTPWCRLGIFKTLTDHTRQLVSCVDREMIGEPEQVHFGTLSTVYRVSTDKGVLFAKIGIQRSGESRKTRVISKMFPDHAPSLLGSNEELELMLTKDHGPSFFELYCGIQPTIPLNEQETKTLHRTVSWQWAQLQKESMRRVDELSASGIPVYDVHWIREAYSEVKMYMRETALDKEDVSEVLGFGSFMERTFEIWERFPIPNSLVHGDLHQSNIAQPGGFGKRFTFFDWDSAFVGHPFMDLVDEGSRVGLEVEAYLEHWTDYGDRESLRRIMLGTKPVRYVIEAVCEIRKALWTAKEKRKNVHYCLQDLMEAWDPCKSEDVSRSEISAE